MTIYTSYKPPYLILHEQFKIGPSVIAPLFPTTILDMSQLSDKSQNEKEKQKNPDRPCAFSKREKKKNPP